ncbi:50S ribosomal protein L4 [Candidatus Terasakiella magnetica]|uniref:Large ribosomal subunit protein uL4 n=1 Tax=Candidatus Terasakiella magnetica TaxID=1867952 RepID=A0A1C3RDH4_9PROT|nr:50S ribosomal protein L4 [Candidatus Terasakiella magnetica]SCA55298.1 50S ribosomal protein L4 [Candidatus Terasakiella magnetica]
MKCDVISLENKKVGDIELDDAIFGIAPRADILHRVVNWQLARRQSGTHKVKTRGELAIVKTKPFKQKGTGNARQGFKGVTQMRGGATVHGPVVRSYAHNLNKKVRKLGLKCALSAKAADGALIVVDDAKFGSPKTKEAAATMKILELTSALFIDGTDVDANFQNAIANLPGINALPSQGANVYDILRADKLVLTKGAVEKLVERLS